MAREKLVRDNMPALLKEKDLIPMRCREAEDGKELSQFFVKKMQEEVLEIGGAAERGTREDLLEEVVDLLEVIAGFCELRGLPMTEVVAAQVAKANERGGFRKGLIWNGRW